jgi:hypothetical protein
MKSSFKFAFIVAMFLSSSALAKKKKFTEADRQNAIRTGTAQATNISDTAQAGNGTVGTSYDTLEQSSKDTMENSQKGQSTATIMKIGMYAMGASYASSCGPHNPGACVKAAVLFMMGGQAGKAANSFNGPISTAWDDSCAYSTFGCSGGTPSNPYTAALTPGVINENKAAGDAKLISDALNKGGFAVDVNSGKIKSPNGEINGNDPASLSAALGGDSDAFMKQIRGLEADAKAKVDGVKSSSVTAALGFDGGGGGMGAIGEGGYGTDAEGAAGLNGLKGLDRLRKPAQAKGLSKNFNGDPIGVASDSIFEMMSRRYQLKGKQKAFFGPDLQ